MTFRSITPIFHFFLQRTRCYRCNARGFWAAQGYPGQNFERSPPRPAWKYSS